MLEKRMIDELEDFLESNFHQDIESIEDAIQEILDEDNSEYLLDVIKFINEFLESSISNKQKEEFIEQHAEIYFKNIGETPIEWLRNISKRIEQKVND